MMLKNKAGQQYSTTARMSRCVCALLLSAVSECLLHWHVLLTLAVYALQAFSLFYFVVLQVSQVSLRELWEISGVGFFTCWMLFLSSVSSALSDSIHASDSLDIIFSLSANCKGMQAVKLCTNKIIQFLTAVTVLCGQ